jgi:uncharacterized coiled-coil protein SlyX
MDTTPSVDPIEPAPQLTSAEMKMAKLEAQLAQQAQQIVQLNCEKEEAKQRIERLEKENEDLKCRIELEQFGMNRFGADDQLFRFYTGFTSVAAFTVFFDFVQPCVHNMQRVYYYQAVENINIRVGRPSCRARN